MTSCGVMWIRTAAAKRSEIITEIKVFKWNKVVAAFDIVHLECMPRVSDVLSQYFGSTQF